MIETFSIATAHHFQDALASQARLRYEVFVKRRKLDHSSWGGLEFDEFDTPAATYLVWRDGQRVVRGVARLLRTTGPYMLRSYWPNLVERGDLPSSSRIFEVTRVCVDKTVEPIIRRTIFPELLCGIQEFLHRNDGIGMIGVTREHLLAHFIQTGIEWLGPAHLVEGEMERAFLVPTPNIRPAWHCQKFGIGSVVLAPDPDMSAERHAA
ncbi:GNAT family N-acetyltransferase [Bradyrhizobium sp. AUGA SZCCT0177]|uniref:acyl-homoserine-lactone synthase n=1 Tax=Bradyrhizobium sp. AUGA SZCCT0177 TaxID=2807665 RepID=UPI001BA9C10E|nr:acyl-homoserine-lactone synthase [Bradyrhizobium sp. AUGA SZCCT0177]MBR1281286.1 GNAT family N-acetyltransferase [Bradyrhizobium sp. AUGA SZCCT0177]